MITYKNKISADEYNSIREAVGWKVLDRQQSERGLAGSEFLTAAYDGGQAVASARVVGDGGYMYLIADVMVIPEYQGRGIGRAMLEQISGWFDVLAADGRCILVNLMATKDNEAFYEKFGFVTRPNESMGAGMVRWING